MANTITRRQGDTAQPLTAALTLNGSAADLTGATVMLHMVDSSKPPNTIINSAMTIVSPATAGNVSYAWQAADVSVAGTFQIEIEVVYSDATRLRFPDGATNCQLTLTPALILP